MSKRLRLAAGWLTLALVGCGGFGSADPPSTLDAVPDRPNFDEHILPIMNVYCNDCHGDPARQDAPDTFRLDRCLDSNKPGAKKYASRIVGRTLDTPSQPMPPPSYVRPTVASVEGATLRRWVEIGAPCTPQEAATSQGTGRFHPDEWFDGFDEAGEKHGLAAKLNTGYARAANETRTCNDATCHGPDLRGGRDGVGCDTCHEALDPNPRWRTNCTWCHGSEADGSGAPPYNIDPSRVELAFPAHPIHGYERATHGAFGCEQCHARPENVTTPGHLFDATPGRVEVRFESGMSPVSEYDAGTCSQVYCHGDGQGDNGTISASGKPQGCPDCHRSVVSGEAGWAQMSAAHVNHLREGIGCRSCHARVVGEALEGEDPAIVTPTMHVNGRIDVELGEEGISIERGTWAMSARCNGVCHGETHTMRGWAASHHPPNWAEPGQHGRAAKLNLKTDPAGVRSCNDMNCHGVELEGGIAGVIGCDNCHTGGHADGWRTDCTYCHGGEESPDGAPPRDIDAAGAASWPRHTDHVTSGDRHGAYACVECHITPLMATSPEHMFDDSPGVAEVDFSEGIAAGASWDGQRCTTNYCHGNGRGSNGTVAVNAGAIACTGCHRNLSSGSDGWQALSGQHKHHLEGRVGCSECHGPVIGATLSGGNPVITTPELHVDGEVQFNPPAGMRRTNGRCSGICHTQEHGSEAW